MICPIYRRLLDHFYDMTDTPEKRRQLEAHRQTCPACRLLLQQEEQLSGMLKAMPEHQPQKPVLPGIWQGIEAEKRAAHGRFAPMAGKPLIRGLAAAAMAAIIMMTPLLLRDHQGPPVPTVAKKPQASGPGQAGSHGRPDGKAPVSVAMAGPQQSGTKPKIQPGMNPGGKTAGNHGKIMGPKTIQPVPESGKHLLAMKHDQRRIRENTPQGSGSIMLGGQPGRQTSGHDAFSTRTEAGPVDEKGFKIFQNVINLNHGEVTRLTLDLKQSADIKVTIYSRGGRVVKLLVDQRLAPGHYEWLWDGTTSGSAQAASGVYFALCRQQGQKPVTFKVMVVK